MSKIGRKPIDISGVTVDVKGQKIQYKGSKASGEYVIPDLLSIKVEENKLLLQPAATAKKTIKARDINREWGLHRALLSNVITGARKEFEKLVEVVGLGYKGVVSGGNMVFTLGFSHKIDFLIPKGITVSVDKTGQKITVSSADRELLGLVCSKMCELRRPEPYKGTGVKLSTDYIVRKAAKGK